MNREQLSLGLPWTHHQRLSLVGVIRDDVRGYGGILDSFSSPGFWAVFWYRVAHALARHHVDMPARVIQLLSQLFLNCEISRNAIIGRRLRLFHPSGVFIGPYCRIGELTDIGAGCFIGCNTRWNDPADYPIIEDKVVIATGAKVMGHITIGTESRIGPNAVVMQSVPARTSVISVPCRMLRRNTWPTLSTRRIRPNESLALIPSDEQARE